MNRSQNLNLFIGLGCKPMKDVVLHHGNHETKTLLLRHVDRVLELMQPVYIEAIPERQPPIEISTNLLNLFNDYGEIEAVKDIEPVIT